MRIRKNAKLSPILFSHGGGSVPVERFQTHVCQLNQSPWDVIPFPDSDDSPNQLEGEDSFTGNGSPGDSIGAVESVASMMDVAAEVTKSLPKLEDMVVDDNIQIQESKEAAKVLDGGGEREDQNGIALSCCQKSDGKGWQCKNEAKQGQSFCDHHLSLLRSYNSSTYNTPSSKKAAAAAAGARRARARSAKKAASSSNPHEFYYYSGFGPSWGKRRGDRNVEGSNNEAKGTENSTITEATAIVAAVATAATTTQTESTPSSSSQVDNEEFDYVDDDEEDDANGDSGKKRMRKPVKARSLKSLM